MILKLVNGICREPENNKFLLAIDVINDRDTDIETKGKYLN